MITINRIVERKAFETPMPPKVTRVAAYARVSTGKDAMLHSLSAQVSYYSSMIQSHSGWLYCGVYSDEAQTGTKPNRPGFQRLLNDCRMGKLDLIITKSVSRFSRNTIVFLETVRELKMLGVDVFLEEQNIHTMSGEGELMMTLLSSLSQEESRSASENVKWRIKKNFESGIPWNPRLLGYRLKGDKYEIVPEEAETVRRIYELYLLGMGPLKISKILNDERKQTRQNRPWHPNSICAILRNDTYTGNLTLQKTYRENHITKRTRKNCGEFPQYKVDDAHDAIVPKELFDAVQIEIARRADEWKNENKPSTGIFTGKLVCESCGRHYRRRTVRRGHTWQCSTFGIKGKSSCASKQIPEDTLMKSCAAILGLPEFDADVFHSQISDILVCNGNKLVFHFFDGSEKEYIWQDRSRSESWTDEMKESARQKTLARRGESSCQK